MRFAPAAPRRDGSGGSENAGWPSKTLDETIVVSHIVGLYTKQQRSYNMSISAAQCRAARALLDWTQEQLAENAQVARATIADFERNSRSPMRNNMVSIRSTLEAAGIELVEENGGGVGVRFRKIELEYSRNLKVDWDGVTFRVRYRGKRYSVRVPRDVIDDLNRTSYKTPEECGKAVEKNFPIFLRAAEEALISGCISDHDYVFLSHEKFPEGVF